jgi:hypothetical protein
MNSTSTSNSDSPLSISYFNKESDFEKNYEKFLNIFMCEPGCIVKFRAKQINNNFRTNIATEDIKAGEIAFKCPKNLGFSCYTPEILEFAKTRLNITNFDELENQAIAWLAFMFEEVQKESSTLLNDYFSLLPKNYDTIPVFYDETLLSMLKNSFFIHKIESKKEEILYHYEKMKSYDIKNFNYPDFTKIFFAFLNRIYEIKMKDKVFLITIPVVDFTNEDTEVKENTKGKFFFDNETEEYKLVALKDIKKGEEVTLAYSYDGEIFRNWFLLNEMGFTNSDELLIELPDLVIKKDGHEGEVAELTYSLKNVQDINCYPIEELKSLFNQGEKDVIESLIGNLKTYLSRYPTSLEVI